MIVQAWRVPHVCGLWIIEDEDGVYWRVPAIPGGWRLRADFEYPPPWEPESISVLYVLGWTLRMPGYEAPEQYVLADVGEEMLACRRDTDLTPAINLPRPMGWWRPDPDKGV
jgi:hypothetical protein